MTIHPGAGNGLRWAEERDLEPAWRVLEPAPASNPGFAEGGHYRFVAPGAGWTLRIDDEPLQPAVAAGRAGGAFSWQPGFFAGEVTAELVAPGGASRSYVYLLDVAPHPDKLGRDVFKGMVDELLRDCPELVFGSEPATHLIGSAGASEDPWIAFARLRRHAPSFNAALSTLRHRPRRALRSQRARLLPRQVRRVDRQTAAAALRSTAVALFDSPSAAVGAAESVQLDVPVVEDTLDCAANRAMAALASAVLHRARGLVLQLEDIVAKEDEPGARSALAPRWPVRRAVLEDIAGDLRVALARTPIAAVTRREISAAGLTAVSADPAYARAWCLGWRCLRTGVEQGLPERLWVSPTWEIYERWCFLRFGQLLAGKYSDWNWHLETGKRRWVGQRSGGTAQLLLQPTFPAGPPAREGAAWSVSRQREPDIVLQLTDASGHTSFAVFDAKYRVSRQAVLDAMASAHIYQDSLRMGNSRPAGSLLLVPAHGGAPWLEVLDFHRLHRVGVVPFAPGAGLALPEIVEGLLGVLEGGKPWAH